MARTLPYGRPNGGRALDGGDGSLMWAWSVVIGDEHELPCASSEIPTEQGNYDLRIDGPLLAKQRELLLKVFDTVFRGESYVAEPPNDQDLLQGIIVLLDEIADQAHDCHGIASLIEPEDSSSDHVYRCECEKPGHFCSGVPGILAHLENGCLQEGAKVERCDLCRRYPSDEAALEKLQELGHVTS